MANQIQFLPWWLTEVLPGDCRKTSASVEQPPVPNPSPPGVTSQLPPISSPVEEVDDPGRRRPAPRDDSGFRRSKRLATKPINYRLAHYTLVEAHVAGVKVEPLRFYIPKKFAQAIAGTDAEFWLAAEIKSLEDARGFRVVPLPDDVIPIPCKWVFDVKADNSLIFFDRMSN